MNCVSNVDEIAGKVILAVAFLKPPVHRVLANLGLVAAPDPVAHDVRTIAFLNSLDLDPVEILGAQAVARAERWTPAAQPVGIRWALPMRSQSLITTQ